MKLLISTHKWFKNTQFMRESSILKLKKCDLNSKWNINSSFIKHILMKILIEPSKIHWNKELKKLIIYQYMIFAENMLTILNII
jgi:hypothetical protein